MPDGVQPVRAHAWLRELARTQPARFPWAAAARAFLAGLVPLMAGVLTNQLGLLVFVAFGSLLSLLAVRPGSYRSQAQQILVQAPLAAAGFAAGALVAGSPIPLLVPALAVMGLVSGLISGYGAAFSVGGMQFLLFAVVMADRPPALPVGVPSALFLVGAAWGLALLGLWRMIDRRQPERELLSALLGAQAQMASAMEAGDDEGVLAGRRRVVANSDAAYSLLLEQRAALAGRSREVDRSAAVMAAVSELSTALHTAWVRRAVPAGTGSRLREIADAVGTRGGHAPSTAPAGDEVSARVAQLAAALWPRGTASLADVDRAPEDLPATPWSSWSWALGGTVWWSAGRLAVCMALAGVADLIVPGDQGYWVPLTVALVLKPDFGSVFARAVQRAAGTVVGVLLGVAILAILPRGILLVVAIAVLAATLQWAGQRSYGLQSALLTPLVLVLVELELPGAQAVSLGGERLFDTLIGSAIVIVFGYLLWPRSLHARLEPSFQAALDALATLFEQVTGRLSPDRHAFDAQWRTVIALRREANRTLSDVRTEVQRRLAEPPPASREAAAWYPAVASAERLCDLLSALWGSRRPGDPPLPTGPVRSIAAGIRAAGTGAEAADGNAADPHDPLRNEGGEPLARIVRELATLQNLVGAAGHGKTAS